MKLIGAFLKLIRLPNLFFILLTQFLFQFCVYAILYKNAIPKGDLLQYILLSIASVCIAAGGYIINDYFDINIDEVNKPQRMVVDKVIHRRWAIAWHMMLMVTGIILTIFAVPFLKKWWLILGNIICVALLWYYSTSFKKKLLIGNLVISALTSWTILVIYFSKSTGLEVAGADAHNKFFRIAFLYAAFAFISSMIREAIKDVEDLRGDTRYGCRTMPIVWGLNATKVFIAVWLIVLLALLAIAQVYVLQFDWWIPVLYSILLIIIPLLVIFFKLYRSNKPEEFRILSRMTKFVMFTGIVSMIFFYYYL